MPEVLERGRARDARRPVGVERNTNQDVVPEQTVSGENLSIKHKIKESGCFTLSHQTKSGDKITKPQTVEHNTAKGCEFKMYFGTLLLF